MGEMKYLVVRMESGDEGSPYFTIAEVAFRSGLHPEIVERFLRLGLIEIAEQTSDGERLFDAGVVPLIRRILRLRNQLGVNYAGIGVILELMSRVETLESRVEELESLLAGR